MNNFLLNFFLNALILSLRTAGTESSTALEPWQRHLPWILHHLYHITTKCQKWKRYHQKFSQILTFHPNYGLKSKAQKNSNSTKLEVKRSFPISKTLAFNFTYLLKKALFFKSQYSIIRTFFLTYKKFEDTKFIIVRNKALVLIPLFSIP